jgi:ABC-type spermidine/putrescine transport system permease subunit I
MSRGLVWMLPALLMVGLLYGAPLLRLAALSFGESEWTLTSYRELFEMWSYGGTLLRTLRISMLVVIGCLLFGYPIGYVLAFSSAQWRLILSLLVLLPFWTSILVRNFAWIYLLRDHGALSTAAGWLTPSGGPAELLYNETGVVIAMVSTLLPFMIFPVFLALAGQSRDLREAAAGLGASPARMFLSVTLPVSARGIVGGSLLVFATAVGFFVTPALLGGGRVLTAATFISQQIDEYLNWPLAAAAAMVLLAVMIVLGVVYRRASPDETDDGGAG